MKKYDFLLFDLDNTLLDFRADEKTAFEQLYHSQGWDSAVPYSPAMLELYEQCNQAWWRKFENGRCAKQELFVNRFSDFFRAAGLSGDPDAANEQYFDYLGMGGVAFPGALDMLRTLGKSAGIYIITNGNAPTAGTRIRNSGLLPLIRDYFVSESIGCAKPDPRYFDYVFAHIPGFEKERAIVIGDSLFSDIRGANNAGIDSLWYRRDPSDDQEVSCTYRADSFEEIVEILTRE